VRSPGGPCFDKRCPRCRRFCLTFWGRKIESTSRVSVYASKYLSITQEGNVVCSSTFHGAVELLGCYFCLGGIRGRSSRPQPREIGFAICFTSRTTESTGCLLRLQVSCSKLKRVTPDLPRPFSPGLWPAPYSHDLLSVASPSSSAAPPAFFFVGPPLD